MKNRLVAGLLALVLGTFGAQKFYLGRKAEKILCLLFFWTGFPTLLGLFEGVWLLTRTEDEWAAYLEALKNPRWYEEVDLVRPYVYPVVLFAFFVSLGFTSTPARYLCLLFLPAIWFYPGRNEKIWENRLAKPGAYLSRVVGTVFAALFCLVVLASTGFVPPSVDFLGNANVFQSGGTYEARFRIGKADKVTIAGKDLPAIGDGGEYSVPVDLSGRVTEIAVHAESHGLATDKRFSVIRAPNNSELTAIREQERQVAEAKATADKARAELAEKQRLADEKCQKDAKCRAQKEEERKSQELAAQKVQAEAKDAASAQWIANGNKFMPLVVCEQAVKDRLKAPSTADFAAGYESSTAVNGGYIWVRSYVDAQNGFGAQIRSQFVCQFELRGNELYEVDVSIF